ncbi:MAG: hypothetical protein ACREIA_21495 [Opitutaceae bacterium]
MKATLAAIMVAVVLLGALWFGSTRSAKTGGSIAGALAQRKIMELATRNDQLRQELSKARSSILRLNRDNAVGDRKRLELEMEVNQVRARQYAPGRSNENEELISLRDQVRSLKEQQAAFEQAHDDARIQWENERANSLTRVETPQPAEPAETQPQVSESAPAPVEEEEEEAFVAKEVRPESEPAPSLEDVPDTESANADPDPPAALDATVIDTKPEAPAKPEPVAEREPKDKNPDPVSSLSERRWPGYPGR